MAKAIKPVSVAVTHRIPKAGREVLETLHRGVGLRASVSQAGSLLVGQNLGGYEPRVIAIYAQGTWMRVLVTEGE